MPTQACAINPHHPIMTETCGDVDGGPTSGNRIAADVYLSTARLSGCWWKTETRATSTLAKARRFYKVIARQGPRQLPEGTGHELDPYLAARCGDRRAPREPVCPGAAPLFCCFAWLQATRSITARARLHVLANRGGSSGCRTGWMWEGLAGDGGNGLKN